MDYDAFVGRYILLFGNLEKTIDESIRIIWNKHFGEKSGEVISGIIKDMKLYKRVKTLYEIIDHTNLTDPEKADWKKFFEAIDKCINTRNLLAHGMYGIENGCFLKFRKNGETILISDEDFSDQLTELDTRYRQLFDSVIEASLYEASGFTWICSYPKLQW